MSFDCPRCGSPRVITGAPMGPYDPVLQGMKPTFRIDSCLSCKHQWTVDLNPKEKPHEGRDSSGG